MSPHATDPIGETLQEAAPHELRSVVGCFGIACIILVLFILLLIGMVLGRTRTTHVRVGRARCAGLPMIEDLNTNNSV